MKAITNREDTFMSRSWLVIGEPDNLFSTAATVGRMNQSSRAKMAAMLGISDDKPRRVKEQRQGTVTDYTSFDQKY